MLDHGYFRPAEAISAWFAERSGLQSLIHGTTLESVRCRA
jgi:hypothetical protein